MMNIAHLGIDLRATSALCQDGTKSSSSRSLNGRQSRRLAGPRQDALVGQLVIRGAGSMSGRLAALSFVKGIRNASLHIRAELEVEKQLLFQSFALMLTKCLVDASRPHQESPCASLKIGQGLGVLRLASRSICQVGSCAFR